MTTTVGGSGRGPTVRETPDVGDFPEDAEGGGGAGVAIAETASGETEPPKVFRETQSGVGIERERVRQGRGRALMNTFERLAAAFSFSFNSVYR